MMYYLKFAITGLLLLWTFTLTYQKKLKFLINEEITGTSPDSFIIEKYETPMAGNRRYIMMRITLTPVFYKTYRFVSSITISRHDECRPKEAVIQMGSGKQIYKNLFDYRVDSTIEIGSKKNQYMLLYLPDGENKVGSSFIIELLSVPVNLRSKEQPVIKFSVKQEPAVIKGGKISASVVTSKSCELASVSVLRQSTSNPSLYTLHIKTYLGSKVLKTITYINTCYWYLNRKTDTIVDTDKEMKKNSDRRFPGLKFKMDTKYGIKSDTKAQILFSDVTTVIGNNVGIIIRVTDKKTWMPKEFEMVMPIQWTVQPPRVTTRRPPPRPTPRPPPRPTPRPSPKPTPRPPPRPTPRPTTSNRRTPRVVYTRPTPKPVVIKPIPNSGSYPQPTVDQVETKKRHPEGIPAKIISTSKKLEDKVSVVATKIKNMKNMTPEQVNDNMMGTAGMVGALFILLTICGICCRKKKKSKEKDAEKDGTSVKNKPTDDKKTDDKKADDKKATDDKKAEDKKKPEVNKSTEDKGKEKRPDTQKKKPTKKKKKKDSSSDSSDSSSDSSD